MNSSSPKPQHHSSARLMKLKERLDLLCHTFGEEYLSSDPLLFPHRYADRHDQEVVALIASLLAYGTVRQIFRSMEFLLQRMGPAPARFLLQSRPDEMKGRFQGFSHRFHKAADIELLVMTIGLVLREFGSIEKFFIGKPDREGDLRVALSRFSLQFLRLAARLKKQRSRAFAFFFPDPIAGGSACKRLNMFLRWMVRRQPPDLGLWSCLTPAQLIIPLDTHIARIARRLGLSDRRTSDWKMAEEITAALRQFDSVDPVKYDFAITRLGILGYCPHNLDPLRCITCRLSDVCDAGNNGQAGRKGNSRRNEVLFR